MGLRIVYAVILSVLIGCMAKPAVVVRDKYYIDCCNPALSYNEKDMCKWSKDNPNKVIVQGNILYQMIWSDCKVGEEPWRKWE